MSALHPAHIVFENIGSLLGTPPSLALPAVQDKLLAQGRGGYCYEQNLLLKEALLAMGMQVTALAARVVWMQPPGAPPRPRSHMLLMVPLQGADPKPFLVDAGFGGQLMDTPLALEPGEPPSVHRITTQAEFEQVIGEQFGLLLPSGVTGALYERVPKGVDQFVLPRPDASPAATGTAQS